MEIPDQLLHREIGTLKDVYLSDKKIFSLCLLLKENFSLWSNSQAALNIMMDKFQIQGLNSDCSMKCVFY